MDFRIISNFHLQELRAVIYFDQLSKRLFKVTFQVNMNVRARYKKSS